jgi:hypothetical protein
MRILLLSLLLTSFTGCTFAPITIRVLPEVKSMNHCIEGKRIVCDHSVK